MAVLSTPRGIWTCKLHCRIGKVSVAFSQLGRIWENKKFSLRFKLSFPNPTSSWCYYMDVKFGIWKLGKGSDSMLSTWNVFVGSSESGGKMLCQMKRSEERQDSHQSPQSSAGNSWISWAIFAGSHLLDKWNRCCALSPWSKKMRKTKDELVAKHQRDLRAVDCWWDDIKLLAKDQAKWRTLTTSYISKMQELLILSLRSLVSIFTSAFRHVCFFFFTLHISK